MNTQEHIKHIYDILEDYDVRITGVRQAGGNHNLLSATHPDTDPVSPPTRGSIIRGSNGNEWEEYGIGAAGRYLRSDGNDPVWAVILGTDLPAHAVRHEIGGADLVDHDNLTNFVANEHIDHTAITLTAGEGLQGGGTIAANRTFDLDVNGLVEDAAGASGDFFVYYDTVAGDHKKIDWDDMPGGGGASPWTVSGNDIYWDGIGHVTIGAVAPDSKMTVSGFNIYTAASSDTLHFVIQNADVAHGFTAYADADTYYAIQKNNDSSGGAWVAGFCDATGTGMRLWGLANAAPTSSTTAAYGLLDFCGAERSGSGGTKAGDSDNIACWINWTTCIMILKGRGDLIFPDTQCRIFLGDSVNTFMNSGITINQKGYDDHIMDFKSSDISQPFTSEGESDSYGWIEKINGPYGGLKLVGVCETIADRQGLSLEGGWATGDTTKSASGEAAVQVIGWDLSGSSFTAYSAGENILAIKKDQSNAVWIVDVDGYTWQADHIESQTIAVEDIDALADDTATSFTPPFTIGVFIISTTASVASALAALISFRVPAVDACTNIAGAALVETTTGVLGGMTGNDNVVTVSTDSASGKIYVENRMGSTLSFNIVMLF